LRSSARAFAMARRAAGPAFLALSVKMDTAEAAELLASLLGRGQGFIGRQSFRSAQENGPVARCGSDGAARPHSTGVQRAAEQKRNGRQPAPFPSSGVYLVIPTPTPAFGATIGHQPHDGSPNAHSVARASPPHLTARRGFFLSPETHMTSRACPTGTAPGKPGGACKKPAMGAKHRFRPA
jgi:hypothetical protein